jgi:glycosyltransferase involved in cell wall biosynthesis
MGMCLAESPGTRTTGSRAVRICYVTETWPPEINGVALTVERTVRHLRERRHRVLLVRPRQRGEAACDSASEWRTAGAPIPMYPDLRFGLATAAAVRERLVRERPALVHVATPGPLGHAAVRAARSLGVPVTCDFRTNFHGYSRHYGLGWLEPAVFAYLRSLHRGAACTFVPTRAMRSELGTQGFEGLEVIGRGVDSARFSPAKRSAALRASWGVQGDDAPVLLYVGRLAAEKNVELALKSWQALRATVPQARMVLVGDGPLRARLQSRYPEARFVGMQRGESLAIHFASADLMLFPSESETFGNVTLEGLASGLGVIAYRAAAAAEHITDGRSGWLVPPGDAEAYAHTVLHVALTAPALLHSVRRRAREAALRATWDEVLDQYTQRLAHHALADRAGSAGHVAVA